jgi:hypothetical protein
LVHRPSRCWQSAYLSSGCGRATELVIRRSVRRVLHPRRTSRPTPHESTRAGLRSPSRGCACASSGLCSRPARAVRQLSAWRTNRRASGQSAGRRDRPGDRVRRSLSRTSPAGNLQAPRHRDVAKAIAPWPGAGWRKRSCGPGLRARPRPDAVPAFGRRSRKLGIDRLAAAARQLPPEASVAGGSGLRVRGR